MRDVTAKRDLRVLALYGQRLEAPEYWAATERLRATVTGESAGYGGDVSVTARTTITREVKTGRGQQDAEQFDGVQVRVEQVVSEVLGQAGLRLVDRSLLLRVVQGADSTKERDAAMTEALTSHVNLVLEVVFQGDVERSDRIAVVLRLLDARTAEVMAVFSDGGVQTDRWRTSTSAVPGKGFVTSGAWEASSLEERLRSGLDRLFAQAVRRLGS